MRKVLVCLAALVAGSGAGSSVATAQNERIHAPGEGVICSFAILTAIANIGRTCHPDGDPALQAELDSAVARYEAYVVANDPDNWTPEAVTTFRRTQGHIGAPRAALCRGGDGEDFYNAIVGQGAAGIRKGADEQLARPGKPSWGTCL